MSGIHDDAADGRSIALGVPGTPPGAEALPPPPAMQPEGISAAEPPPPVPVRESVRFH